MFLCGCKISSQAPFCDGVACQKLLKGEEFNIEEDMLYLDEEGGDHGESTTEDEVEVESQTEQTNTDSNESVKK